MRSLTGSIREITRRVFNRQDLVDGFSFSDGWLSLLTGSDFSRGNLVKSFFRAGCIKKAEDEHSPRDSDSGALKDSDNP